MSCDSVQGRFCPPFPSVRAATNLSSAGLQNLVMHLRRRYSVHPCKYRYLGRSSSLLRTGANKFELNGDFRTTSRDQAVTRVTPSMNSGTKDVLLALRSAIKSQSTISYTANGEPTPSLAAATHLVLPSQTLPKSTPTRFRRPGVSGSDPTSSPGDFFTLDAIYVTWLLRDASVTEYMKQARDNGLTVGLVSVTERKSVVDWLEGKATSHPNILPLACE